MLNSLTMKNDPFYHYLDDGVSFRSQRARDYLLLYMPLCGPDAAGVKSSITPYLSGDIKSDKFNYLTKPVSREDLRNSCRNVFVQTDNNDVVTQIHPTVPNSTSVTIGQLWHQVCVQHPNHGLEITSLNFVPSSGENVELMKVTIKNISDHYVMAKPTVMIPIFARSLANKHDHEHVTSLLNRIEQLTEGVLVQPTMKFNEEGHLPNQTVYSVFGCDDEGKPSVGSYPTMQSFCGEGGGVVCPQAVFENREPLLLPDEELQGNEAVGALRFKGLKLSAGQEKSYFMVFGIAESKQEALENFKKFNQEHSFNGALEECKKFWLEKSSSIKMTSAESNFDSWMRWVTIQPVLRRIFGCSFLPDHDYGKGGKGWRDLWQDLLSLILIEPETVKSSLLNNFSGIRIDGSNATIIGEKPGEFIADRNAITRVWMDHGAWPLLTTDLYIQQTGDLGILNEKVSYFCDGQFSRSFKKSKELNIDKSNLLTTDDGDVYTGTVLEHLILQNCVQFFNVGEHNCIRLESADWNDGLDMAFERGESVAFSSFYAGNLNLLADLLGHYARLNNDKISLAEEMIVLLDTLGDRCDYENVSAKKSLLFNNFFNSVQPKISGKQKAVLVSDVISDLRTKSRWMIDHLNKNEIVSLKYQEQTFQWMNGYYNNIGQKVEGLRDGKVRMTLTGQVFPLMFGVLDKSGMKDVHRSVQYFLKDKELGGYRLNSDFQCLHDLNFGRAFGFAFGTKENGSFFSHMTVMYAYALYKQNFVKEGFDVLRSIYQMAQNTEQSKIYPGIPEYFDSQGRGMYHYLTGSASWLVLTMLTQVVGLRGQYGDLLVEPKLVKQQFDESGLFQAESFFAGKRIILSIYNPEGLDYGEYKIHEFKMNDRSLKACEPYHQVIIPRNDLEVHSGAVSCNITLHKM